MIRRGSVNWQDGMLIEASHFTAETEHLRGLIGHSAHLALGWFGLYAESGDPAPLDLSVKVDGLECTVELRRFRGIFRDGLWVDFEAGTGDVVVARCAIEATGEQSLPIHLFASGDEFHAFGEPDPAQDPPRAPWRQPLLQLALGAAPSWSPDRSMVLGNVRVRDGVAVLDPERLPPCATMSSWPALRDLAARYVEVLEKWRRTAVDHFIVLLPVATAPTGGTGRQMDYARRETAFQWALEVARLQAMQPWLTRTGTPPQWFSTVQSAARSLLTLLDLNREMTRGIVEREESALAALRRTASHLPNPEDLGAMLALGEECMDAVTRVLGVVFGHEDHDPDQELGYQGRTYHLTRYARRSFRREGDREFLEISGLAETDIEDYVVLLGGEVGKTLARARPTAKLGPNERNGWTTADSAELDVTFRERAVLAHPLALRLLRELNRLTLICIGAENLSAFERGADEDVRVYVLTKHST
jgi:hypothetical protein